MKAVKYLLIAALLSFLFAACGEEPSDPKLSAYTRTVEGRAGLAIYVPRPFKAKAMGENGYAGFTLEYEERELVGAVFRTNASNLSVAPRSEEDVTSPAFARRAQRELVAGLRKGISDLLPRAQKEGDGWRITAVEEGVIQDQNGNYGGFGRYFLEFGTAYRIRSVDVFRYIAKGVAKAAPSGFPADLSRYHPAGANRIDFAVSFAMQQESGFYTGGTKSRMVDVAVAAIPSSPTSQQIMGSLDGVLTFKSLGNVKQELVEQTTDFTYTERGRPVDFLLAIDVGQNMAEERELLVKSLGDWVDALQEAEYDWRLGLITHASDQPLVFENGANWLGAHSGQGRTLLTKALNEAFATGGSGRNSLLANAVSFSESSGEASFRRAGAPLLLFTASDRDDASLIDNQDSKDSVFYEYFAKKLARYSEWIALSANLQNCRGATVVRPAQDGKRYRGTALAFGGETFDFCRQSPSTALTALAKLGAQNGARFRFERPLPLPFTLSVALNGKAVPAERTVGFSYDVLSDRLEFSPAIVFEKGDTLKARYMTLQAPQD